MNLTRSFVDYIKARQLQWCWHVQGKWQPEGEKIGGKPELTWMDGIQSIKVG